MPEISIITPVYNASKFLNETIQSVLDQSFKDWEWVLTDDHSTDNSVEIIRSIKDPRILLIESKLNGGAGYARNLSLEKASGRYITFLDADDVWENQFLEEMLSFMKKQNAELVYSSYVRCDENLNKILPDFEADRDVNFHNMLKTCRLSLLSSVYDSKRVGKEFFPKGSKREDHIMWLNLLKKIPEGKALKKTMAKYRMHPASISRKKSALVKEQYLVYRKYMGFSVFSSFYYTLAWAVNGFRKYNYFL